MRHAEHFTAYNASCQHLQQWAQKTQSTWIHLVKCLSKSLILSSVVTCQFAEDSNDGALFWSGVVRCLMSAVTGFETIHTSLLNCFKHSVVEFIWHDGLTLNRIKGAAVQLCTSLFHTFSKFRIRIAGAHAHATSFRCVWRQRLQEAALDGAFSAESWLGESHGTWGWTWTKMASGELMQRP